MTSGSQRAHSRPVHDNGTFTPASAVSAPPAVSTDSFELPQPSFATVRKGYDPPAVDGHIARLEEAVEALHSALQDSERRRAMAEQHALGVEEEIRAVRSGWSRPPTRASARGPNACCASPRARPSRSAPPRTAQRREVTERALNEAERHRHEVRQRLIAESARAEEHAARRASELQEREDALRDRIAGVRAEAEAIRAAAERAADAHRAAARADVAELRDRAAKDLARARELAERDLARLRDLQETARRELGRMAAAIRAELGRAAARPSPGPTGAPRATPVRRTLHRGGHGPTRRSPPPRPRSTPTGPPRAPTTPAAAAPPDARGRRRRDAPGGKFTIMPVHGPPGPDGTADAPLPPRPGRSALRMPPAGERFVGDLVADMSVEEKVRQLTGAVLGPAGVGLSEGPAPGVVVVGPRPLATMAQDLAEVQTRIRATSRRPVPALAVALHDPSDLPAFPVALARAATWDVNLVAGMAAATAGALAAAGVHATTALSVAPASTDAAWADIASSLGSDSALAAELVRAHVHGLQGTAMRFGGGTVAAIVPDVGGTAGQAVRDVDHAWSERTLRTDISPPPRPRCARARRSCCLRPSSTTAFPCTPDARLLQRLLRAEWGFGGVVMATAGEVLALAERHHVAETADAALALAIESGVHVVLVARRRRRHPGQAAAPAGRRQAGRWLVDAAVVTVLQLKLALGLFEDVVSPRAPLPRPARHALAARATAESTVLLTDPRGVLPLGGAGEVLVTWAGQTVDLSGVGALVEELAQRHPGGARAIEAADAERTRAAAVVVVVDEPEGAEIPIGRLVATGQPCVALVSGGDPRALGPIVATTTALVVCWQPVHGHADTFADILVGRVEPGGRLPVPITGDGDQVVFPLGHRQRLHRRRVPPSGLPRPRRRASAARRPLPGEQHERAGGQGGRAGVPARRGRVDRAAAAPGRLHRPVELDPGRTMTVTLRIPATRLALWDRTMRRVVEPGAFSRCSSGGRRPTCGCAARSWWRPGPTSPPTPAEPLRRTVSALTPRPDGGAPVRHARRARDRVLGPPREVPPVTGRVQVGRHGELAGQAGRAQHRRAGSGHRRGRGRPRGRPVRVPERERREPAMRSRLGVRGADDGRAHPRGPA